MAKSFIHYQKTKGILYASVYTPRKVKGKKDNQPQYLGRVVDKEQGIYRNKERGVFRYSLEDGFSLAYPLSQTQKEEKRILDFGDVFVLQQTLQSHGYWELFRSMLPGWEDTLCAMLFYRVLRGGASCYACDWWSESYLRMVCPNAKVESQRVSEFFAALGDERVQRQFFQRYMAKISEEQKNHGILINSTGMPNDIHFPITAVNNHYGVISSEARLILVVDRLTKLPLLYQYNAGNIVEVSTLKSTILELSGYGVSVDFSILDAGYYSEKNVEVLYAAGIRFVTRLAPNRKLYKDLVASHIEGLESRNNAVFYRECLLYIKCVPIDLCGHLAYAYVAIDHQRRSSEGYNFMGDAVEDKHMIHEENDKKASVKGLFIVLSSENMDVSEIITLYYTRQAIEQAFDFDKNNADLLPLKTHGEDTFRGHLMLSFISTVSYLLINRLLDGSKYCADGAFRALHNLKCKVFDDYILVKEAPKKIDEITKHLKVDLPLKL